jgi:nitrate/nitrite transporter NarK
LFLPHSSAVLLIIVFTLVGFGTSAHLPAFWALPTTFLSASAAAAAIGFINCIASIGGFFGPKLIGTLSQRTGSFDAGFVFMSACLIIASVLVLLCPRARVA